MKEQISLLVDGESTSLERERALRALREDSELRNTWERYHLVSSSIRRELDIIVSAGLADRIHDRLQGEQPESAARWRHGRPYFKLVAGLAIAASVATVAIFNLSPVQSPPPAQLAQSSPAGGSKAALADARQVADEQQRALGPYLVPHGEFAGTTGMNGMLSYVRVVGYEGAPAGNGGDAPAAAAESKTSE
jgi:sigma-E factor negative regulatory protein RseA